MFLLLQFKLTFEFKMSVVKNLRKFFEDKNHETGNQKTLQKHQWNNGIWYNYDSKMTYMEIDGDKIAMKNHYHFDYPDMKHMERNHLLHQ